MNIRGIFFDLYGTLLIYGDMRAAWSDWFAAFYTSLLKHGLSISREDFSYSCDQFFSKDVPQACQNGLTVLGDRIKTLCSELDVELKVEDIKAIASTMVKVWQHHITLDKEAIPLLKSLYPHKVLGLISNFDHPPHVRRIISEYGFETLLKTAIISGDVGCKKPDPRIFIRALEETGLEAGEVVYVGDTADDVEGAKAAGIKPILIQREDNPTDIIAMDYSADNNIGTHVKDDDDITVIAKLSELAKMFP